MRFVNQLKHSGHLSLCHSLQLMVMLLGIFVSGAASAQQQPLPFFAADHPYIRYTGRIDFSNPKLPRFWQPGVYIEICFEGTACDVILNDEILWGKNHNYLEVVLDGQPVRLQTRAKTDTINVGNNLSAGRHVLLVCKNTEANIGYLELVGFAVINL